MGHLTPEQEYVFLYTSYPQVTGTPTRCLSFLFSSDLTTNKRRAGKEPHLESPLEFLPGWCTCLTEIRGYLPGLLLLSQEDRSRTAQRAQHLLVCKPTGIFSNFGEHKESCWLCLHIFFASAESSAPSGSLVAAFHVILRRTTSLQ